MAVRRWTTVLLSIVLVAVSGGAGAQCRQGPFWEAELVREKPLIAASAGFVERLGDTLLVTANGRRLAFTHEPCRFDEPLEGYLFKRHDVALHAFVIDKYAYELHVLIWIDDAGDRYVELDGEPVASPDGRWLVVLRPHGQYSARLRIWSTPDLVLASEYEGDIDDVGDWFDSIEGWDGNERVVFSIYPNAQDGRASRGT